MAGVSTKAIKSKIKSMQSTRQITKAMELVASSKLRGAQNKALKIRAYYRTLFDSMQDISNASPSFISKFLQGDHSGRPLYVVIAGDRGLAGGYNSSIFKLAESMMPADAYVLPYGKKALEYFRKHGYKIISETFGVASEIEMGDCFSSAKLMAEKYISGKFGSVTVIYTRFDSILSQNTDTIKLLPLEFKKKSEKPTMDIIYETGGEAVFDALVPEYLSGVLYGCLCESLASEQAARRNAMNSATKNADEMISKLDLQYNRARQSAITQEITEIVAGSEA